MNSLIIANIDNFKIDYETYKKLIYPISDLISSLWDVTKNVYAYVHNDNQFHISINGYSTETLIIGNNLNNILVKCITSYNKYKSSPNSFNPQQYWGRLYPKLNIDNIDNSNLRNRIDDLIAFFALYNQSEDSINNNQDGHLIDFKVAVLKLCYLLNKEPESIGLTRDILNSVPNVLSNSEILNIVAYSMGNVHNNNSNQYNSNNNTAELHNNMPNNNAFSIINMNNSQINVKNVKQCFDPLMASNTNITPETAVLYILNKQNKIIRTICLDEDSFDGILKNNSNIFYQCKPTVPQGAIFISESNVLPTRLRKIAIDIIMYVYENQAKKIKLGKKYVLIQSDKAVGRIASYNVVRGGEVVSSDHCQNDYKNDFIYIIKEYNSEITEGGKRRLKKTRRHLKKPTKKHLKKTKKHLKKNK